MSELAPLFERPASGRKLAMDYAVNAAIAGMFRSRGGRAKESQLQAYLHYPAAFVMDCFEWRENEGPAVYQLEILSEFPRHKRVAVRGPHALGKTALAAFVTLWFALTRDALRIDWKLPTTAGAWRQLSEYLWPEIHKWARRLKWDKIGREPFSQNELLTLSLQLNYGSAFAVASSDPMLIEGAHADSLMYIFDESKAIEPGIWDAAEGAFSGAGKNTGCEAYALACSTPGENSGRFYEIHQRKPGFEDWWTRKVSKTEVIVAGRMGEQWAEQRRLQWGEKSAVYQNRVEGEFASADADGLIPLAWVEAANERWRDWKSSGKSAGPLTHVGVDVAWTGEDNTVLALRHGSLVSELRRYSKEDPMETAGRIAIVAGSSNAREIIDTIGIGAGTYARRRELGGNVVAFNAAAGSDFVDRSGELQFANLRSAAWWNLHELLDPTNNETIALPPDDDDDSHLTSDLTAIKYRVTSNGKLLIEDKDTLRKRIGRSTDDGDAVMQVFAPLNTVLCLPAEGSAGQSYWTAA
jgi:hypothetical protein